MSEDQNPVKRSAGQRIIESLDEVRRWQDGEGTMRVTMPGQPARDITFDEYAAEHPALVPPEAGTQL